MFMNHISSRNNRQFILTVLFIVLILTSATSTHTHEDLEIKTGRNFLWSVEDGKSTIFLMGSIHLLTSNFYPLDKAIENAYDVSKKLVFEADLDGMNDPVTLYKMLYQGLYPKGQTLAQHVSEQTYELLVEKAASSGIPMAQFDRAKPWYVAVTLYAIELEKLKFDPNYGIDSYFFKKAKKDQKELSFLETVDYQISLFTEMSKREQELILRQTLKELEVIETMVSDIVTAWKTGDTDRLDSITKISFKKYPSIYNRLIVQRNREWMPKIEELIKKKETALVVVGAGHLIGEEGLIELLRKKGYKVKQR